MPRRSRNRTEIRRIERQNADRLGDDFKFSADPKVAAQRRENRRKRREVELKEWHDFHRDKWTRCIVPGCKFTTSKLLNFTSGIAIAICSLHQIAVWEHVNDELDDPDLSEARAAMKARRDAILLAEQEWLAAEAELDREERRARQSPDALGQIYYARVGGLIKVGWTSDLYERIRSYGPDAELLAHYKATRRDETALHRNLAPSRAKGREWYHDDAIIRAFVSLALREHGEPRFTQVRWTKPAEVVAGKRVKRTA